MSFEIKTVNFVNETSLGKFVVEGKESKLSDDELKKLYNQMKDEQLSAAAAMQFKAISREIKKRKL